MYSKSYWISCDEGKSDALMEQYNTLVVPAIKASENHVGHHMFEAGPNKWLLVSNYHNKAAAEKSLPMVRASIPMATLSR